MTGQQQRNADEMDVQSKALFGDPRSDPFSDKFASAFEVGPDITEQNPATIAEDLDGMSSDELEKVLAGSTRSLKVSSGAVTVSDEIAKVSTDTLKRRIGEVTGARDAFNDDLNSVSTEIMRLIERRQYLRNEINQCNRILDALNLADLSIDIT